MLNVSGIDAIVRKNHVNLQDKTYRLAIVFD